jgi:hypothetical protein
MSNRFNKFMNTRFAGCPVLNKYDDTNRGRVVTVFDVGSDEVAGAFDGVDAWMLPRGSPHANPPRRTASKATRLPLLEEHAPQEPHPTAATTRPRVRLEL